MDALTNLLETYSVPYSLEDQRQAGRVINVSFDGTLRPEQPKRRGRKKRLEHIGQIGAGKNARSGIIDIATMQSLFEGDEKDVKPFVAEYGMVLCDECHHVAAFTFEKILREVRAQYVYGLSDTPVRQDGHQPIIFMQCGPIRYWVDAKSQAEKRAFSHYVIPRFTRTRLPATRKLQDFYAGIIENEARTNQIVSDAARLIGEDRTPLLLTERRTILLAMPVSWKGVLAQYAGRLHRNYEGTQEVSIYDYVDIHISALGKMYHKWLKGYPKLGCSVKMSEQGAAASQIYNGQSYLVPFMTDLSDAIKEILLVCPFLNKSRIKVILPALEKEIALGVSVTVCTRAPESYRPEQRDAIGELIVLLQKSRIDVRIQTELLYRYAVIDQSIVWYGNIGYLSYSLKDANALRFESPDTAGELLDLWKKEDEPEQLHLEMSV